MLQRELSKERLKKPHRKSLSQFNLRKITERDELIDHFGLRYEIYLKTGFIEKNDCGLDIDPWDFKSDFFGIFDKTERSMLGTIRCILPGIDGTESSEHVRSIIDEYSMKMPVYENESWFPMMQAFDLDEFLGEKREYGKNVFELGRLTIKSLFMGNSLGVYLGDYAIREFKKIGADICLIAVHPRHSVLYRKLGFEIIPGTGEVIYPGINKAAVAMSVDLKFYKNDILWGNKQNDKRRDPVAV